MGVSAAAAGIPGERVSQIEPMSEKKLHFFISAGEASGDLHGGDLVGELLRQAPHGASVSFLGGDNMAREVGHAPLVHYSEMAYMGFAEVLRHLPSIARILKKAKEEITASRPDALILIDYPSFNLKLARHAKSLGIPVFYYISPKVWAWKEWRVKDMRRLCDKILSILPFETDYFRDRQLDVEYVGNPSVAEVERKRAAMPSRAEMNLRYGLDPNRPLLALIPGSRRGEIRVNLPIMVEAAQKFPQLQPVVAAAPSLPLEFYRCGLDIPRLAHIPVIPNATFPLMAHAEAAFVTSGTATLECALLETPQVVCYRSSGKKWFYNLMSHVLKCPHISLPNLIANGLDGQRFANEVVPELLMHHCNPEELAVALARILPGQPGREQMLRGYGRMKSCLTTSDAPARAASVILSSIAR